MARMHDKIEEVAQLTQRLKASYPTEIESFLNFMSKAEGGPALDAREKELINVGLAVAAQCEWCIALHVKHAANLGASRDERVEAGFQAVIMHGGPALMYMVPLFEALDEFLPEGR